MNDEHAVSANGKSVQGGGAASTAAVAAVYVWDLPVRLFHWLLVASIIGLFVTGKLGGNWMEWHKLIGFFTLGLVVFRIIWGVVGSEYARFASFVRGPGAVLAYLRGSFSGAGSDGAKPYLGHNPLGALSVLGLLAVVLFQAISGLFADDDILMRGPYANAVSGAISAQLTKLHKLNSDLILVLVGLHLAAIAFYFFVKKENLVKPMLNGSKVADGSTAQAASAQKRPAPWLAWALAICVGVLTYLVVTRAFG
ncbi:MAG: cytochrome b/b6 domain-containing protein [Nitrosomonadaceae bacterium]|nr:cytochrome b/b6 domain-containing protein [Nitrosomonadaceae bacterium]